VTRRLTVLSPPSFSSLVSLTSTCSFGAVILSASPAPPLDNQQSGRLALSAVVYAHRSTEDASSEADVTDVLGGVSVYATMKQRWSDMQYSGAGGEAPLPLQASSWVCDSGLRSCAAQVAVQVTRDTPSSLLCFIFARHSDSAALSVAVIRGVSGRRFELRAGHVMLLRCFRFRRPPLPAAAARAIARVLPQQRRSLARRQCQQQRRHAAAAV
jgi:hypothetical protein